MFIAVFVINQFGFLDPLTKTEIVVASHEIDRDHVIQDGDLTFLKIDKGSLNEDMFLEKDEVIGKVTTQAINSVEYISPKHFDSGLLKPTSEHEFFPIPDDWIMELQGTLRRYDLVNITAVFEGEIETNSTITTISPPQTQSTIEIEENAKSDEIQNVPTISPGGIIRDFVLKDVPVAFVKSNNNEEVTGESANEDRLKGTDTPSSIELSLTLEQFKTLEELYANGYRFILSYR